MTSLPAPNQDPGFNINTAMNTFNQRLGELVRSGQMTVAQAQAAQADMRALQLNPAAANRQAATDIAQRHLQVGKYHPENIAAAQQPQGGLTMAEQPEIMVTRPTPMPTPTDMREVIGSRMPPPGVRGGDTRIFADQPMAYPGGDPDFNESTGVYTPDTRGLGGSIGGILANFGKSIGNAPMQPKFIGQHFTGDAPPPGKKYIETPEGLVPVPINDMPMRPSTGTGLGSALGMPMQPQSIANAMQQPQGLTLSNVPQSARLTLSNVPQQPQTLGMLMQGVRMPEVPQYAPPPPPPEKVQYAPPTGMAMGGLMRKYGGMC